MSTRETLSHLRLSTPRRIRCRVHAPLSAWPNQIKECGFKERIAVDCLFVFQRYHRIGLRSLKGVPGNHTKGNHPNGEPGGNEVFKA